jgi:hypothetical protein
VAAQSAKDADLLSRRDHLRAEYDAKVEAGEIRPRTEKEKLETKAAGHPDRADTQAAQRVLEKRQARAEAAAEPEKPDHGAILKRALTQIGEEMKRGKAERHTDKGFVSALAGIATAALDGFADGGPESLVSALEAVRDAKKIEDVAEIVEGVLGDDSPVHEGDRKTEAGVEYVLRGGRWHRAQAAAEPDPEFAAMEDRQDLAEAMAKDPHADDTRQLIQKAAKHDAPPPEPAVEDDLDPSSPNYRYRDTGHVPGSRKELAALMIRRFARERRRVRVTDVDWEALEENPREAKELIVKANIFGDTDWSALDAAGMDPGAGFLLSKVYASVAPQPAQDTAEGRRDYSLAITTLRDRLEAAQTPDALLSAMEDISAERDGVLLNETEKAAYEAVRERLQSAMAAVRAVDLGFDAIWKTVTEAESAASALAYEISKRDRRKWKVDPEQRQEVERLQAIATGRRAEASAYRKASGMEPIVHKSQVGQSYTTRFEYPYKAALDKARSELDTIKTAATLRNRLENPLTRAWHSLGPQFQAVLNYRRHKGSEAFAKHVAGVKAGKVSDWSWANKERASEPRGATKQSTTFQLIVADDFQRSGGRALPATSTAELKSAFNLREVQSGNWVLDDPNAAKFHVEACAAGFADMADILGVEDAKVSFNGRLAMAFGARGKGGKGAAAAHYEPVHRVINITKVAGAGSLAHEWFHMLDNLVKEAVSGIASDQEDFATLNPAIVDDPKIAGAFRGLVTAMMEGPHRKVETMSYTESEERWADHNVAGYSSSGGVRRAIRDATSLQAAVDEVDKAFERGAFGPKEKPKARKSRDLWRKIALIHHGKNPERLVSYESGPSISGYLMDAVALDQGDTGKYWSAPHEMAARAFSAYVEDKLHAQGRKNTYLVYGANNRHYAGSGARPFPDRDERERVNGAFDKLFEALREDDTLAKAGALFGDDLLEGPADVVTAHSGG